MPVEQRIIFNSSLPRSGSTLLQNILAQNPRFYCSPTSGVFDLLCAARTFYSQSAAFKAQDADLMRKGFQSFCRYGLEGFYRGITDKPVCVDKSRPLKHYYEWVRTFVDDPKIIVCIRDLRGILASMEKLFQKNRDIQDLSDDQVRMNMMTRRNRVIHWLNTIPVGVSLTQLMDAVELGHHRHFHIVRFEDLTTNPKGTLEKVYDYLGEPPYSHDFDNVQQVTQEDDSQYPIYGDHKIRQKVQPVQPDWNEVLGKDVSELLKDDNKAFYDLFYPGKI